MVFPMDCATCHQLSNFDCHLLWSGPADRHPTPETVLVPDILLMRNRCICQHCGSVRPHIEVDVYFKLVLAFRAGRADVLL